MKKKTPILMTMLAMLVINIFSPLFLAFKAEAATGNLVINHSVENPNPSNPNVPNNWSKVQTGNNSAYFKYTWNGYVGFRAVYVQLTNYISGRIYWSFKPVPLSGGETLNFIDFYRSNVSTDVLALYTLADGSKVETKLATLPSSSYYKRFETNFTAPDNARSVVVGHILRSNGYLETDNYKLFITSVTPTPTATPTSTPKPTVTATPSSTPRPTTVTATPTVSPTNTPTPTVTLTPTVSVTPTVTVSPTVSPTVTPSITPTVTITPTITPPVYDPNNLTPNPSLETVNPNNTNLPANWSTNKSGTNNATFTYLNTGHTGTRSMEINISNFTSGWALMASAPIPVQGGRTYLFSDYFKSDAYSEVDAEINLSDGTTQYIYVNYSWPSASWTKFTGEIVMPANAVSVVVYHLIYSQGYLTTDDYSLTLKPTTPPAGFNRALVSLTFDDGVSSQYASAYPLLTQYGMKGTFYIVSSYVNTSGHMTATQLQSLHTNGHEIGGHSVNHIQLTTLGQDQLTYEVRQCQLDLQAMLGFNIYSFATPYGEYNDAVIATIRNTYNSHRSTDVGFNNKSNLTANNLIVQNVNRDTSVATVQSWIDQAIAGKYWLILVYHEIDNGSGAFGTTPANLTSELSYMQQKGVTVKTVNDALSETLAQL